MEQHIHGHTFRNQDIDRIMASYGKKPSKEVKQRINSRLESQKKKFIELSRIREMERSRKRGRSR